MGRPWLPFDLASGIIQPPSVLQIVRATIGSSIHPGRPTDGPGRETSSQAAGLWRCATVAGEQAPTSGTRRRRQTRDDYDIGVGLSWPSNSSSSSLKRLGSLKVSSSSTGTVPAPADRGVRPRRAPAIDVSHATSPAPPAASSPASIRVTPGAETLVPFIATRDPLRVPAPSMPDNTRVRSLTASTSGPRRSPRVGPRLEYRVARRGQWV